MYSNLKLAAVYDCLCRTLLVVVNSYCQNVSSYSYSYSYSCKSVTYDINVGANRKHNGQWRS